MGNSTATVETPSVVLPLDVERAAYKRAAAVADRIVAQLPSLPRMVAVVGDLAGFRIRLNFGTGNADGVLQFAAVADTEVVRAPSRDGVWVEARATVEGIPVCAEVLMSGEAAAVFEAEAPKAVRPVPLGASVLARVPAVIPVTPAPPTAEQPATEPTPGTGPAGDGQ
ncbi:hypothetical protein [Streptomyces sp. NPDC048242]|uniref:hypothetical protein n=1 Tax=Streptomyces sp. NPDC048242 TaxID=3155026 RepID=UPI00343879B5